MRLGLGYEGTSVVRCGWAKISSRLVTGTGLGAWGGGGGIFFQTLHILWYEGAKRRRPLLHIL